MVVAVGLRDEAVVVRIVHCAEENAVQLEQSGLLVELILDLAFSWDFNDGIDDLGRLGSVGHAVPGVLRIEFFVFAHWWI